MSESPPVPGPWVGLLHAPPSRSKGRNPTVGHRPTTRVYTAVGWGVRGTEAIARLVTPHTERGRRLRVVEYPDVCDTGHAPPSEGGAIRSPEQSSTECNAHCRRESPRIFCMLF